MEGKRKREIRMKLLGGMLLRAKNLSEILEEFTVFLVSPWNFYQDGVILCKYLYHIQV